MTYVETIKRGKKTEGTHSYIWDITNRKRTERTLQESEMKYRALFEHANDAVFLLDLDGKHIDVNKKAANMIALGAYFQKRGFFSPEAAARALPDVLAQRYHNTLPLNTEALHKGAEFVLCRV